jgi:hypothetical protein
VVSPRRWILRLVPLVAFAVFTTAFLVLQHRDEPRKAASSVTAAADVSPQVLAYFNDLEKGLAPLLMYVRALPGTITALQKAGTATTSQLNQAGYMAESFATARDLVGRIAVPAQAPPAVGELMQVACQLYRQSALALTELRTARGPTASSVLRRSAALHELGDRVIDQVRRVLAVDRAGAEQANVEYRYAPPVPAVAVVAGQAGPSAATSRSVTTALREARRILDRQTTGLDGAAGLVALHALASSLEQSKGAAGEDVVGARIAILLALLAEDASLNGSGESSDALLMLSNDVWAQARTLTRKARAELSPLAPPRLAREHVWTGGAFNGTPPPLKPGQDVGAGLPGGLPAVDPSKILRG